MMVQRPLLIALDADGVLVDYNAMYGQIYQEHFGVTLTVCEPTAYHCTTYWGVENPERGHAFWDAFHERGWSDMPAMPGALEACQRLVAAGYRLVCVTSLPVHRREQRVANLQALGFPIDEVIATGTPTDRTVNPKKEAIEALAPDWFVDDELRKLKQLPGVQCVLVDPGHVDDPNVGQDDHYLVARVADLQAFADMIVGPRPRAICGSNRH